MRFPFIIMALVLSTTLLAQDTSSTLQRQAVQNNGAFNSGKSKFMIRGYFNTGFEHGSASAISQSQFRMGKLSPVLMYKESERLFFEAELNAFYEAEALIWDIEYADMSYVLNKYMTARAGLFLLPFGTFTEKLHPAWINRLASKPLGFDSMRVIPTNDIGLELRGAFYTGSLKMNYQAYIVNGPQLNMGIADSYYAGRLNYGSKVDNNTDKAIGGRVGLFPFTNSMLEIGLSALRGRVDNYEDRRDRVGCLLYALDVSLVHNVDLLHGIIDFKGQYNHIQVDDVRFLERHDSVLYSYTFNNVTDCFYAQLAYRPISHNKYLRKMEAVCRFSELLTPDGSHWSQQSNQLSFGINYWIDWRTVIKIGYESIHGLYDAEQHTTYDNNTFSMHWAMGF